MSIPLDSFNPAIDRYDRRSAARLFNTLWPDAVVSRAAASNLAASIRTAHAAGDACWEVTMYSYGLRLNVGQVETLTLDEDGARFLFKSPLELGSNSPIEVNVEDGPAYRAVPVPSGVCIVPASEFGMLPMAIRHAHDAYVQAAASFKRVSPFKKSFSPAVLEYLEEVLAIQLPRPSYITPQSTDIRVEPLPDELDLSVPLREGAKYPIVVNAYERDPRARQLCIAKHGTDCVICGFSFGASYGPVAEGFIHVHHLRLLSEPGEEHEVDPVADLRPVCPNCHAVIHRQVPPYSIEEVQEFLKKATHT